MSQIKGSVKCNQIQISLEVDLTGTNQSIVLIDCDNLM